MISTDETKSFKYGHSEVLRRLKKRGASVYRTDEHGTVIVAGEGLTPRFPFMMFGLGLLIVILHVFNGEDVPYLFEVFGVLSLVCAVAVRFAGDASIGNIKRYVDEGGNPDAPGHFIAWLVGEMEVRAAPVPGRWFDIGSLEGLAQGNS